MGNCEGHPRRPLRLLGRVCRCEIRSPSSPRAGGNEAGQGAATHVLPPRLRSASASRVDGGGQCLFTQHPLPPAGAAAPPQPALGGGGVRERGAGGSFATRRRQLQLGLGEQQAPEREGGDCRSGSRRPGRERSPRRQGCHSRRGLARWPLEPLLVLERGLAVGLSLLGQFVFFRAVGFKKKLEGKRHLPV